LYKSIPVSRTYLLGKQQQEKKQLEILIKSNLEASLSLSNKEQHLKDKRIPRK
jgi:hypothetical protein